MKLFLLENILSHNVKFFSVNTNTSDGKSKKVTWMSINLNFISVHFYLSIISKLKFYFYLSLRFSLLLMIYLIRLGFRPFT